MLLLFVNLYGSMLHGSWLNYTWANVFSFIIDPLNAIGKFLTSIFGDNTFETLGTSLFTNNSIMGLQLIVALILALITSIGIVVMAVKGVKKAFGIFFMGIR